MKCSNCGKERELVKSGVTGDMVCMECASKMFDIAIEESVWGSQQKEAKQK